jgi:hypothetical protein
MRTCGTLRCLLTFMGIVIAGIALVGHLTTTTISGEHERSVDAHVESIVSFLIPFLLALGLWGLALLFTWKGWLNFQLTSLSPKWLSAFLPAWLKLALNPVAFITIAGYLNSLCLGRMVYVAGGVYGLFAPVFLLVPHTTAVFLHSTENEKHVFGVLAVTLLLYFLVYCKGTNRTVTRHFAHGAWSIAVLGSAILVEIYLIFLTQNMHL